MNLRLAKKEDVIYIKLLIERNLKEILSKYHSKEIIQKFIGDNSYENLITQLMWKRVYTIEENGKIIATGAFANFGTEGNPKYSVSNLCVLPEYHKKGIGTILVSKLIQDAVETNASEIHVPSSRNAVPFYQKMGFIIDKEQIDSCDEITWMTKELSLKKAHE